MNAWILCAIGCYLFNHVLPFSQLKQFPVSQQKDQRRHFKPKIQELWPKFCIFTSLNYLLPRVMLMPRREEFIVGFAIILPLISDLLSRTVVLSEKMLTIWGDLIEYWQWNVLHLKINFFLRKHNWNSLCAQLRSFSTTFFWGVINMGSWFQLYDRA